MAYEAKIVTYGPKSDRVETSPAKPSFFVVWLAVVGSNRLEPTFEPLSLHHITCAKRFELEPVWA